jgi:cytochrome c oxidase subunit 3
MPPTIEHVEVEKKAQKPKLGGGGPGKIPHRRGYGGGGDDGDRDRPDDFLSRKERLRRYRIAIIVAIVSVTTLFIGLTLVYLMRQGMGHWDPETKTFIHDWHPLTLPYRQLLINTFILILSSITLELARKGLLRKEEFAAMGILPPKLSTELPWLGVTVLLGFGFLGGQIVVWNSFRAQGIYLASNPSSSFFYLLTGLHAIHLLVGLLVLLLALFGSWLKMRFESQQTAVDVTGWYWHFMGLLWIYLFALLHFAKG